MNAHIERPWFQEDNKKDFEADGLRCAMRRGPLGSWCGYVAVSQAHPWHGKSYTDKIKPTADMFNRRDPQDHNSISLLCMALSGDNPEEQLTIDLALRVHGGITYAADHAPYSEPTGEWWFGFDCAHAGDLIPGMEKYIHHKEDVYRDQAYVVSECQSLAAQLNRIQQQKEQSK